LNLSLIFTTTTTTTTTTAAAAATKPELASGDVYSYVLITT
jgi:hypothetical protein